MDQKPLGRSGLEVSAIGLGCVTFGREIDEDASYRVMDYAMERGIMLFDTAEIYGGAQSRLDRAQYLGFDEVREVAHEVSSSERVLGRWLKSRGSRKDVMITTKFLVSRLEGSIAQMLEASLERLNTDYVDIFELHAPDPSIPLDEIIGEMSGLVDAGLTRVIGCSNHTGAQLQEALDVSASHGYARFEVTQPLYNLAVPGAQDDLFPICASEEVAVTPYSPLAAGFLSGKYTQDRSQYPKGSRFDILPDHADIYFSDRSFRIVDKLRVRSEDLGTPMVKMAMAWVMSHPTVTAALIGARTTAHIDNAVEAYELGMEAGLRAELAV
jgi:aryl-alcohol dehydrogenase-like predicted oxidoreductase